MDDFEDEESQEYTDEVMNDPSLSVAEKLAKLTGATEAKFSDSVPPMVPGDSDIVDEIDGTQTKVTLLEKGVAVCSTVHICGEVLEAQVEAVSDDFGEIHFERSSDID